ncbi:MAG: hypoxanthine phosphoribosyltransferase [Chitinophagaceae bacterium]
MSLIQVLDKKFELFISAEQIQQRIREMAVELNRDFSGQHPLFLAILNGSFIFAADLFRELDPGAEISFIKLVSYQGMESSGKVVTSIGLEEDVRDRTVIILEDIVESGRTLFEFLPRLLEKKPRKITIVSLFYKPQALAFPVQVNYLGFSLPNDFLVGYGLDYQGQGRNLKSIYQLVNK